MKVILTYAATLNGKITKGDDARIFSWTSKEDQENFKKIRDGFNLVIRSSKTYEASKESDKPRKERLIVVLTRDPSKYESDKILGQLEFTNEPPAELIKHLEGQGYNEALLAAGGKVSSLFFGEKLINEFHLTLEPKIFGMGTPMIAESDLDVDFKLESTDKLNEKGSLLLKYSVVYG